MEKLMKVMEGKEENYIFPFLWLHGEDEKTLRKYIQAIAESNIRAVCIESRPHPDFCGERWWNDMDVILDEARKRDMKVWILDDSHFPTGFANGAMKEQPEERCRQSICCRVSCLEGKQELMMGAEEVFHPDPFVPSQTEMYIGEKNPRVYMDDRLLGIYAVRQDAKEEKVILTRDIQEDGLYWKVPEGRWNVYTLHLSRNMGYHRSYINMLDKSSCRVLIDSVYEPHYEHYKEDFGTTIAGFFSDEPELGNGHLYQWENQFGTAMDFPWSSELEDALKEKLGENFDEKLILLWEENAPDDEKAYIRYTYMDCLTRLVEKDFSYQIGNWCREHGVQYIGHLIEDNDQDSRTGSSLGHYFRGLSGQDMAGIDNIGGQVLPGGEDLDYDKGPFAVRKGEFFHYMLGKLGNSLAVLDPLKQGRSMCEIFGNYGWSEGVQLEKYMLDHFLVRGINHYVPHAFSAKEFPDPDCPPHFYAHGNNPQYRHFGYLMSYANRVCELISDGRSKVTAAILYHGEADWTGKFMYAHRVGRQLLDNQINYDYVPQDVFQARNKYKTKIEDGMLKVNTQKYSLVIVPYMQYIRSDFALVLVELQKNQVKIIFINDYPQGICDTGSGEQEQLLKNVRECQTISEGQLVDYVKDVDTAGLSIYPPDNRLRFYHYEHEDRGGVYFFVNEGTETYEGKAMFRDDRKAVIYDAWDNRIYPADYDGNCLEIKVEPLKSRTLLLSPEGIKTDGTEIDTQGTEMVLEKGWKRSICRSLKYPEFGESKQVCLPDDLAEEKPDFSGFVRYETFFSMDPGKKAVLEITDAKEGVEVFLNGSSLGVQIVPPYRYGLTGFLKEENKLVIEVATTLEREMVKQSKPDMATGKPVEATSLSGITGRVTLYLQ